MTPTTYNFSYYKGDSLTFYVYPKDSDGQPIDVTAATFVIASDRTGSPAFLDNAEVTVDANGYLACTISQEFGELLDRNTTYVYDIQGDETTYVTGSITVVADVDGPGMPALGDWDVNGNLSVTGTLDVGGVVTGQGSGITNLDAVEVKTSYESNADTNAFTNTLLSKLNGIEDSADVTDTDNVTAAGAVMYTGSDVMLGGDLTVNGPFLTLDSAGHALLKLDAASGYGPQLSLMRNGSTFWNIWMDPADSDFRIVAQGYGDALTIQDTTMNATFGAGVTVGGDLAVDKTAGSSVLRLDVDNATYSNLIRMSEAGSNRWEIAKKTTSRDLGFYSYGSGAYALTLAYSDGAATFAGKIVGGQSKGLYVKNAQNYEVPVAYGSRWGYSSGYRTLVLGTTDTNPTNVTISLGYDPINNTNGSFNGNGSEILFRNAPIFTMPNAADNDWIDWLTVGSTGNVSLSGTATINGGGAISYGSGWYNFAGSSLRADGGSIRANSTIGRLYLGAGTDDIELQRTGANELTVNADSSTIFTGDVTVDGDIELGSGGPTIETDGNILSLKSDAANGQVGSAIKLEVDGQARTTVYSNRTTFGGYLELGAGGPTITTGSGAPTSPEPQGSLYFRTDSPSTMLYARGSAWLWVPQANSSTQANRIVWADGSGRLNGTAGFNFDGTTFNAPNMTTTGNVTVGGTLTVNGETFISLESIQTETAAATDFADYQSYCCSINIRIIGYRR